MCGKGDKIVLIPLPPAVGRAIERAIDHRNAGPILLTSRGTRMDHRARQTLDRHPNYILAAYMASGT